MMIIVLSHSSVTSFYPLCAFITYVHIYIFILFQEPHHRAICYNKTGFLVYQYIIIIADSCVIKLFDSSEPSPQSQYAAVEVELIKCDSRCGLPTCKAHFQSEEDLANHIRLIRKPQCRHVSDGALYV